MPYIAQEHRSEYDVLIRELAARLRAQSDNQRKGHANYVITQLLRRAWALEQPEHESYSSHADVIGTLECAKLELYRRVAAPYEDAKRDETGDVYRSDPFVTRQRRA